MDDLLGLQQDICHRFGAGFLPTSADLRLGVSIKSLETGGPLHGFRHPPVDGAAGWYIWAGDSSEDCDFFEWMEVGDLVSTLPQLLPYLGLEPGWRFLLTRSYEDAWFDPSLLDG